MECSELKLVPSQQLYTPSDITSVLSKLGKSYLVSKISWILFVHFWSNLKIYLKGWKWILKLLEVNPVHDWVHIQLLFPTVLHECKDRCKKIVCRLFPAIYLLAWVDMFNVERGRIDPQRVGYNCLNINKLY